MHILINLFNCDTRQHIFLKRSVVRPQEFKKTELIYKINGNKTFLKSMKFKHIIFQKFFEIYFTFIFLHK